MAAISCDVKIEEDLRRLPVAYPEVALDISTDEVVAGDVIPDVGSASAEGCLCADAPVFDTLDLDSFARDNILLLPNCIHSIALSLYPWTMYHTKSAHRATFPAIARAPDAFSPFGEAVS